MYIAGNGELYDDEEIVYSPIAFVDDNDNENYEYNIIDDVIMQWEEEMGI